MSNKYIKQIENVNFVYPNNVENEYDVEIIHNLQETTPSGAAIVSSATGSATGITMNFTIQFLRNTSQPFCTTGSTTSNAVSIHMMAPNQNYFKPWRLVYNLQLLATTQFLGPVGLSTTILPSQLGLTSFTNGTYRVEFRFIGKRAVYPICASFVISSIPVPTPTPTATPTPTPTPTSTSISTTYFSGVTLNVTDTGWIKYYTKDSPDIYIYQQFITTGSKILTGCVDCASVTYGIPFADLAAFTTTTCGTGCSV